MEQTDLPANQIFLVLKEPIIQQSNNSARHHAYTKYSNNPTILHGDLDLCLSWSIVLDLDLIELFVLGNNLFCTQMFVDIWALQC